VTRPRNLKTVLFVLALALVAAATGTATFAAFTSVGSSASNTIESGTVAISDNDVGAALLTLTLAKPGDSDTGCIEVTYSGSLDSSVRLYADASGAAGSYLTLTVTRGTDWAPAFKSCDGFTADETDYIGAGPGVIYSGALSGFPATYDAAIVDAAAGAEETWTTSEIHSYRFVISVNDDNDAQGQTGAATFYWDARNL
jgi:predicted ribosomally synthesized peptide with SipW-like signal peptide